MEQTADTLQSGTKDMAQRTLSAAEQNLRTTLDYAERFVRAKDLQDLHTAASSRLTKLVQCHEEKQDEGAPPWLGLPTADLSGRVDQRV
jgi:phasin protein